MRCLTAAFLLTLFALAPHAQSPSDWPLSAVLSRAATYIGSYGDHLSGLVVEESYVQDVVMVNRFGYRMSMAKGPVHRTLKSDLLLVKTSEDTWMQFRDVFEVDGRPVRDRNDRLAKLFLEPASAKAKNNTDAQALKIARESARYNIGDVERTINLPVLALSILERQAQTGFQFTEGGIDNPPVLPRLPAFTPPAGAVVVGFTETQIRSIVVTPQGKNLKSRGRFWITLPEGHVMMSEMAVEDFTLSATIHVAYGMQPNIKVPVPVEMHEVYYNRLNNQRVEGAATYTNFRQFNVKTDEAIDAPDSDK